MELVITRLPFQFSSKIQFIKRKPYRFILSQLTSYITTQPPHIEKEPKLHLICGRCELMCLCVRAGFRPPLRAGCNTLAFPEHCLLRLEPLLPHNNTPTMLL